MNTEIPFDQLGLSPEILETIQKKGFTSATEIQAKSIPVILGESHDIVGIAQTGTGKTAAFGLPLIDKISLDEKHVKCIILTPTRELALQVSKEIDSFKGRKRIKTLAVYGGQPINFQIKDLKRGIDIVVGTPGRVMDLIKRKVLNLSLVEYFILDEADEMLKMGFIEDIESIMDGTADNKRVFLYSATMPLKIKNLSKKYMKNQVVLEVKHTVAAKANIEQYYYKVRRADKLNVIQNIITLAEGFHGIIFCQTKVIVNEISDALKKAKLDADCIHGDISQSGRERILKQFKDKKINILVATDVAARGIDVADLTHVINHSLPREMDSYIHRIGRTGRAGKKGIAMTFIDNREEYKIKQLIRETKNDIVPGTLPSPAEVALQKQALLLNQLADIIEKKDISEYANISKQLVQAFGATEAVSALLFQINGPSKAEPQKERYDHDEYRRKSGRTGRGKDGGSKAFGRNNGKSRKDRSFEKNRATRRADKKRTDDPFKKSDTGYKGGFPKKRKGGSSKKKSW